jgi:hypothetical protein
LLYQTIIFHSTSLYVNCIGVLVAYMEISKNKILNKGLLQITWILMLLDCIFYLVDKKLSCSLIYLLSSWSGRYTVIIPIVPIKWRGREVKWCLESHNYWGMGLELKLSSWTFWAYAQNECEDYLQRQYYYLLGWVHLRNSVKCC